MSPEQEWFLEALRSFPQRLMVISGEFEILAMNRTGAPAGLAEIVGQRCYESLHGLGAPCDHCAAVDVMKTGRMTFRTRPQYNGDDRRVPCYFSYPIRRGDQPTVAAYATVDFDVPALDMVQEQQRRSQAFLQNLLLSAADCVIAADPTGRILIYNDAAQQVFGYQADEAIDRLNVRAIYDEGVAHKVMRLLRADEPDGRGKLIAHHVDIVAKDSARIPISLNASIVYEDDKEVATIGYFHDRREQISMQKEMERTQLQIVQAEKMVSLGKLAAGVAHQLNNPLGGIILFTKLVTEEYELEEGVQQDLEKVLNNAKRCQDTVKELLEFARQTRFLMHPHDLHQAINRTLFLLESQVLFQNITIVRDLADPPPIAKVDIQQINHLLMNLLLNAAQAMEGRGRLTLRTRADAEQGLIRLEISDTGGGIPDAVLPHIFDPFFTTKGEGEGTGLGLSLAYGIVKDHNGTIRARNLPEGGASFIIELPMAQDTNGANPGGEPT